jgi:hypothetical protein
MKDLLLDALGGGLGLAILWFPLTYFAMRKTFNLARFGKAFLPFTYCVAALGLIRLLSHGAYESNSAFGIFMELGIPLVACALVLRFLYPKNSFQTDGGSP